MNNNLEYDEMSMVDEDERLIVDEDETQLEDDDRFKQDASMVAPVLVPGAEPEGAPVPPSDPILARASAPAPVPAPVLGNNVILLLQNGVSNQGAQPLPQPTVPAGSAPSDQQPVQPVVEGGKKPPHTRYIEFAPVSKVPTYRHSS